MNSVYTEKESPPPIYLIFSKFEKCGKYSISEQIRKAHLLCFMPTYCDDKEQIKNKNHITAYLFKSIVDWIFLFQMKDKSKLRYYNK